MRFLNIIIVPFIHLLIALFLPDIRIHASGAQVHLYKQLIRPLLLLTRLSKEPEAAGYLVQRRWSATVLPMFSMLYCAEKQMPKIIANSVVSPYE